VAAPPHLSHVSGSLWSGIVPSFLDHLLSALVGSLKRDLPGGVEPTVREVVAPEHLELDAGHAVVRNSARATSPPFVAHSSHRDQSVRTIVITGTTAS
jgi:hypothetical protein